MMIFNIDQLKDLQIRAQVLWNTLADRERHGYTSEMQAAFIEGRLQEIFEMGYGTAMHEVSSTPWEWVSQPILTDAARNDAVMNGMAAQGWEFRAASSHWVFWRRRKAVSDGQTPNNAG